MSTVFNEILKLSFLSPGENGAGVPAILWGDPGIAKTGRVMAEAEHYGLRGWLLSPGQHGHGLFGVVPVPRQYKAKGSDGVERLNDYLVFPPPLKVLQFQEQCEGYGLVFMDEMTAVESRAVRPAMLGLLHGRCLGDFKFPAHTRVIAAGNPSSIAANGVDISIPEANRLCHIDTNLYQPSAREVADWRRQRGYHYAARPPVSPEELRERREQRLYPLEKELDAKWNDEHAKTLALWAGLCSPQRRQDLLHAMPKSNTKGVLKGWPSQRSWDAATSIYTTGKILGSSSEAVNVMLEGCVGSAATEFLAYVRQGDLPDVEEWLTGKVKFMHDPKRPDRTFATLDTAAAWCVAEPTARKPQLVNLYKWMLSFHESHPGDSEYLRFAASTTKTTAMAAGFPEFGKLFSKLGAILAEMVTVK